MSTTPVLGLPELAAQQQQPEITHNTAIVLLQALQYGAKSIGANSPPGGPADGNVHIVGPSPTGAWAGRANTIAIYYGGWKFVPDRDGSGTPIVMGAAQRGLKVWLNDDGLSPPGGSLVIWDGVQWQLVPGTHIDY